jgi:hypothetical protein
MGRVVPDCPSAENGAQRASQGPMQRANERRSTLDARQLGRSPHEAIGLCRVSSERVHSLDTFA